MNINISEMVRRSIAQALRDAADQMDGVKAPGPNMVGAKPQPGTPLSYILALAAGTQFRPSDVTAATGRTLANVSTTLNRAKVNGLVRSVSRGIWERI